MQFTINSSLWWCEACVVIIDSLFTWQNYQRFFTIFYLEDLKKDITLSMTIMKFITNALGMFCYCWKGETMVRPFFCTCFEPCWIFQFFKCKLWFHFIFGLTFFIPVWVYFPLFQIMIMSMRQIKTKIKLIWKKLNKVKIGFLAGQNRPWQILMNALCFTCDIIIFDLKGHHL